MHLIPAHASTRVSTVHNQDLFKDWTSYSHDIVSTFMSKDAVFDLKRRVQETVGKPLSDLKVFSNASGFFLSFPRSHLSEIETHFPSVKEIPLFTFPQLEITALSPKGILLLNKRVFLNLTQEQLENKLQKEFNDAQQHLDVNESESWNKRSKDFWRSEWDKKCKNTYVTPGHNKLFPKYFEEVGVTYTQGDCLTMQDTYCTHVLKIPIGEKEMQIPLLGVFDGNNGWGCANYLSERLPHYLNEKLAGKIQDRSPYISDLDLFNTLKNTFVDLGREFSEMNPGHTITSTATIALMFGLDIWVANVGDSRAILSSKNKTIALSEDANLKLEKYLKGVWKRGQTIFKSFYDGKEKIGGEISLPRAVGYQEQTSGVNPRSKIIKYSLSDHHDTNSYLILATKGLWRTASSKQVSKAVQKYSGDKDCIEIALELAKNSFENSSDNISVMVAKFPEFKPLETRV